MAKEAKPQPKHLPKHEQTQNTCHKALGIPRPKTPKHKTHAHERAGARLKHENTAGGQVGGTAAGLLQPKYLISDALDRPSPNQTTCTCTLS